MSFTLTVNGTGYTFPDDQDTTDTTWGQDIGDWASAVTSGMLQKAGGTFTLTAEVDFGATYGVKAAYFKSRTANTASAGAIRLANSDTIKFRNAGNSADIALGVGSSDNVPSYATIDLVNLSTAQTLTNKTLTSPVLTTPTITTGTATGLVVSDYEDLTEIATPGSPAASKRRFYVKSDGLPYLKDSSGTERAAAVIVTNWGDNAWTPTGGWTGGNVTYTGQWRRVGDTMECRVKIVLTGAPTGTTLTITLPASKSVDTAKMIDLSANIAVGDGQVIDASPSARYPVVVAMTGNAAVVQLLPLGAAGTYADTSNGVNTSTPITFVNGDTITARWSLPISGWTINTGSTT